MKLISTDKTFKKRLFQPVVSGIFLFSLPLPTEDGSGNPHFKGKGIPAYANACLARHFGGAWETATQLAVETFSWLGDETFSLGSKTLPAVTCGGTRRHDKNMMKGIQEFFLQKSNMFEANEGCPPTGQRTNPMNRFGSAIGKRRKLKGLLRV